MLNLLLKYVPKNDDEIYGSYIILLGIMNILEERLKSSSSGVILDTIKVLINFATISK